MSNSIENIDKKQVVSSFVWKLLERIFTQGINLIVQIVLARLLLPSDFGSLAIIVAITNYAAIFVQSGIATAIVQKKNIDELDVSTLLSSSIYIASLFYIAIWFLTPVIAEYYQMDSISWPLRVLSLVLFLNALNSVQTAILTRDMKFKSLFIRSLISIPVSGAVGITMALNGCGLWALVAQILSNALLVDIVMFFGLDYKLGLQFSLARAKQLYPFCIGLLLTSVVSGLSDFIRTLTIGKRYDTNNLAYYDKANTYSGYVTQIATQAMASVLLPTFSRSQNDDVKLLNMARKSISLSAFVMFPLLVFVVVYSENLVSILLTDKWIECVPYLQILCFMRIACCITIIDKQLFYAKGNSKIGLVYELCFFVINMLLIFTVLPFGLKFFSIGVTLLEVVGMIGLFIVNRHMIHYSINMRVADLYKPAISTTLMVVVLFALNSIVSDVLCQLLIGAGVAFVTYLLASLLFKDDNLRYIRFKRTL